MRGSLGEIAGVFAKLGLVAFGGPVAHVALMRREVVDRRRWLDERAFLEYFAACQLIPGPTSTELAILLGYKRAGVAGLVIAGSVFIGPAMAIMLGLAWLYREFASSVLLGGVLHGIRPVVAGIIVWALLDLGRRILRGPWPVLVGLAVALAALIGLNPVLLLVAAGVVIAVRDSLATRSAPGGMAVIVATPLLGGATLLGIFLAFLKFGAVSFGSGYVLYAFLHADVVQNYHWLTDRQLLDAVAISQATPGPVFTVATFIGFLVAGLGGALLATLGIFLPGFVLVPFLDRIVAVVRTNRWAAGFLEGVNVAALGLIAAVALQLGRAALVDPITIGIALVSFVVLLRAPLAAPLLVIAGGVVGVLLLR